MNNYAFRVGVVGFAGYSGAELVRLLAQHPHVEPVLLEHRADSGGSPAPIGHSGPVRIACTPEAVKAEGLAVVFLATPAEVSMELAPAMLSVNARVVDLSGAFRFAEEGTYTRWYREKHTATHLLPQAVYGLPEVCRRSIGKAQLVANPGCYPTAANLAIRPLIAAGVADRSAGLICDAKSGVSGAGRKAALTTSFCEVTDNFSAYSVLDHKHVPEILKISGLEEGELSFAAQLIPIARGILETIYFRANNIKDAGTLLDIYKRAYHEEPFIRLYSPGVFPDIRSVAGTNFCDIGLKVDTATGRVVVVSAIDNLVKGAAGQAVQNMNLMLGLPEGAGLL